jgi:putative membrane protein
MFELIHSAHHHFETIAAVVILPLLTLLLAAYWFAAMPRNGFRRWDRWHTASFTTGIVLLALAVAPPLTKFAHADLRGHMLQHLLLGMFAPLGLVLGAPGTLLLRTLPAQHARYLVAWLDTPPLRILIHPITALMLDIGGMFLLYLTPLYALSAEQPMVHVLVHIHFVLSGYLFIWAIAGPDPAPRRPSMAMRLILLFIATAAHATLAKIMFAFSFPKGTFFSATEIQAAAQLMYYCGDLAELLLIIAFFRIVFRGRFQRGNAGFAT